MTAAAQRTCATVLFVDLRGYTRLAERLPAARVVPLLDEFLNMLTMTTERYGGQIYHVAGDGLFSGSVAQSDQIVARPIPEPKPFLRLPQFALKGRTAPLDIYCVPAPDRVAV